MMTLQVRCHDYVCMIPEEMTHTRERSLLTSFSWAYKRALFIAPEQAMFRLTFTFFVLFLATYSAFADEVKAEVTSSIIFTYFL